MGREYVELREVVATIPDLETCDLRSPEVLRWIGRAGYLLEAVCPRPSVDPVMFTSASQNLVGVLREHNVAQMREILHRHLARLEAESGLNVGDAVISAGDTFAAFVKISDIVRHAEKEVWIIDPYQRDEALRDYAPSIADGVTLRLLTSIDDRMTVIEPAARKWRETHKDRRPLEVRRADGKLLHDRVVVVDHKDVWLLSQSLNAFAARAPATVLMLGADLAPLKIAAYEAIWANSNEV